MDRLKIILFMLNHASARAIDRAGADWIGGEIRRARADAHESLANEATRALLRSRRN
ncbi:hypothetical protein [Gymnodinialimonas hymeniacidonis]|uniref:hypothetical protein n=1 Tax=Gymnodinialimonas hymeniacidonis TaxID=3126508 RepID=UPI0034C6A1FB